jgi:hypothetical protein
MNALPLRARRCGLLVLLPLIAAACTDGLPTSPTPHDVPRVGIPALQCLVDMQDGGAMSCTVPDPVFRGQAFAANRLLGGQDVYVRLSSSGNEYDSGAGVYKIDVTLQNLLSAPFGTSDGVTVSGVQVFFPDQPAVVAGTGEVTLINAYTGFITGPNQSYFLYNEILDPYEISDAQPWRFSVPSTVSRFTFTVYVNGAQDDESQPLLDDVWDGSTSTDWTDATNWASATVPDSASAAVVPAASTIPDAFMPTLVANAAVTHLRVATGSSLGLGGFQLTAWGNVDVLGSIATGTLRMRGSTALLRGIVPSLTADAGNVTLQGTTQVNGAVTITGGGSITLSNYAPLKIVNTTP